MELCVAVAQLDAGLTVVAAGEWVRNYLTNEYRCQVSMIKSDE